MLSINTNLSSLIAQNSLTTSTNKLNQAIERMTTGFKINHAKDNAANYSISTNMSTKIGAYDIAADNVAMGMDLVTTASDIISTMQAHANRLQALSIQARNGTYGSQSLEAINTEAAAIMAEINRLSSTAEYNGISLFEGGTEGNGFISNPVTYSEVEVAAMTTMTELVNGTTSADNKYSISSVAELEALAKYVNDGNDTTDITFVLGKNLDLSSIANWTPIGIDDGNSFYGIFDGNGHIIKNLKIDSTEDYQGLFGVAMGEIKNIGIENCNVKGGTSVAGLVGASMDLVLSNCYAIGSVSGYDCVGGLGGIVSGVISDCYAIGNVVGNNNIGGFAGTTSGSVINCYASVDVVGIGITCGFAGLLTSGTLTNCYSTGDVTSEGISGGIGFSVGATVMNSYSTGNISGNGGINNSTDWNGTKFNYETGTYSINTSGDFGAFTLQVGINGDESCQISFDTNFLYALGAVKSDITSDRALDAITKFTNQLSEKSTMLGAVENRLNSALDSIEVNLTNLTSSLSTIRDADIAEVSSEYICQQILQQASATLMSTANQSPSIALQLI